MLRRPARWPDGLRLDAGKQGRIRAIAPIAQHATGRKSISTATLVRKTA